MDGSPSDQRIQELEVAIATALKLNSTLHSEIEKHVVSSAAIEAERDAWKLKTTSLINRINMLRKLRTLPDHLTRGELSTQETREIEAVIADQDAAYLTAFLAPLKSEAEEAALATRLSFIQFTPTQRQEQAIASLLNQGHSSGWLINPSEVSLGTELGSGSFGTTFKASYRGSDVACKRVRISSPSELTTFLREIETLSLLKSPHIVPFIGACLQSSDHFYLVTELMTGGTLDQWVASKPGSATRRSLADRAQMCLDVAKGMVAMHSSTPPIYHRDLKPSNVLIDGGGRARVGDMGFSRRLLPLETKAQLTGETGTYLYMAPEVMRHEVYDESADVWSWGALFSEIMTGSGPPYQHLFLTPVQVGLAVAQEQLSPSFPEHLPIEMQVVGRMATHFDPRTRPSFADIVADLTPVVDLLKSEQNNKPSASGAQSLADIVSSFSLSWGSVMGRTIYQRPSTAGEQTASEAAKTRPSTARDRPSVAEVEARVRALTLSRAPEGRLKAEMLNSAIALVEKINSNS